MSCARREVARPHRLTLHQARLPRIRRARPPSPLLPASPFPARPAVGRTPAGAEVRPRSARAAPRRSPRRAGGFRSRCAQPARRRARAGANDTPRGAQQCWATNKFGCHARQRKAGRDLDEQTLRRRAARGRQLGSVEEASRQYLEHGNRGFQPSHHKRPHERHDTRQPSKCPTTHDSVNSTSSRRFPQPISDR